MPGKRDKAIPPPSPAVPERAKKELGFGTLAGLLCAEAMSSVRLFGLGERVGFAWYLAWLLPAALDIYAITMVRFFSLVPATHPLRRKAAHEAIIALVITVGCNGVYETIIEFAAQLPHWAPGVLFVLVSALAPFVAGRLIHFRSEVGNGAAAAADTALQQKPPVPQQRRIPVPHAAPEDAAAAKAAAPGAAPQPSDAATDAAPQNETAAPDTQHEPAAHAAPHNVPQPNPEPAATSNGATRLVPKAERIDLAIDLIARHGRDNVSGTTVGDALGKSRDTGIRVMKDVNRLPDLAERIEQARARLREAGEAVADAASDAEEPDRELVDA